ncbi:MAG: Bpu10I family restriction endonuclease [Methanobacteriota archaeon]|nr:MAG: Bpu10I family restriction endonuclease [Euryarchaeota archaeon]
MDEYRRFLDLEIIFDSPNDFLYRQKGQLKLDNTVLEEFLPHLVFKVFPQLQGDIEVGPQSCYAALYFTSTLGISNGTPGIKVRVKDQDFTLSKRVYIKASFDPGWRDSIESVETRIGYLCAECKTNLDKTMFQEANATAHDVKTAVPGAKYLLLCEWLDMTPISTAGSDIDEVLILRKARRIGSQFRSRFSTWEGRKSARTEYEQFLRKHPFAPDVFERFIDHIRELLEEQNPDEEDVLQRGFF